MKNTVVTFQEAKNKGEKLSMLTAYDYSTARLIDEAASMPFSRRFPRNGRFRIRRHALRHLEDMIHHSAAVARASKIHCSSPTCLLCLTRLPSMMLLSMPDA